MKKIIIALLFIFISNSCYATKHLEGSYQAYWCKIHNGIMEYKNPDKTRVDCLTETHAVEFDFANVALQECEPRWVFEKRTKCKIIEAQMQMVKDMMREIASMKCEIKN